MVEYTGDHRRCDCEEAKIMDLTQDVSWNPKCVFCSKDLRYEAKALR